MQYQSALQREALGNTRAYLVRFIAPHKVGAGGDAGPDGHGLAGIPLDNTRQRRQQRQQQQQDTARGGQKKGQRQGDREAERQKDRERGRETEGTE